MRKREESEETLEEQRGHLPSQGTNLEEKKVAAQLQTCHLEALVRRGEAGLP